jgi:hypothetical protein
LTIDTRYIYQAKGVKNGQEVSSSNEAEVTFQGGDDYPDITGQTPADDATGVGVTPTFGWNSVSGAARYLILVGDENEPKWVILTNGPVISLQYGSSAGSVLVGPKPLQQGTEYVWWVSAYDQYYYSVGDGDEYDFTP